MRGTLRAAGLVVAAAASIASGSGAAPHHVAEDVCVTVVVSYYVDAQHQGETGPPTVCVQTPFEVFTLADQVGVDPYLVVSYEIRHP